jgi:hypothetical protein
MTVTIYDVLGLIGASLSIYCFARLQWRRNYARHMSYSVLNFLAALLIGASLAAQWSLTSFALNAMWGIISLYGIYRCSNYIRKDMADARANLVRANKVRAGKRP